MIHPLELIGWVESEGGILDFVQRIGNINGWRWEWRTLESLADSWCRVSLERICQEDFWETQGMGKA